MASLNLYRRHTSHCAKGYELHRMTSKHQEDRREVKKCTCPIYASGTLNRTFKRRNTQQTT